MRCIDVGHLFSKMLSCNHPPTLVTIQNRLECANKYLISAYKAVFRSAPYFEHFTSTEVQEGFERIFDKKGLIIVAREDQKIVGFTAGFPRSKQVFWAEELGVIPSHRRRGVSRLMIHALYQELLKKGYQYVLLKTNHNNTVARLYYRKLGFYNTGKRLFVPTVRTGNGCLTGTAAISHDERIFYRTQLHSQVPRYHENPFHLERIVLSKVDQKMCALVFDQQVLNQTNKLKDLLSDKQLTDFVSTNQSLSINSVGIISSPARKSSIAKLVLCNDQFNPELVVAAIPLLTLGYPYAGSLEVSGFDLPIKFETRKDGSVRIDWKGFSDQVIESTTPKILFDSHFELNN